MVRDIGLRVLIQIHIKISFSDVLDQGKPLIAYFVDVDTYL